MSDTAWSDAENDAIIFDYLEMIADELAGGVYRILIRKNCTRAAGNEP